MVSITISLAAASMVLLQVASARDCTARMIHSVSGGFGGPGFAEHRISVWFDDDPDNVLDSQDNTSDPHMDMYDGKQTLKSDQLGGDVVLWAYRADSATGAIASCEGLYMDQEDLEGTASKSNEHYSSCDINFSC